MPIYHFQKFRKLCVSLEIRHFAGLQLQLQLISDESDEFGIRRLALRIADGIAEEPLERIQIPSVPGYFDGMSDGPFHSAGGGLEGFCHLRVEHLGDGIGGLAARLGILPDVAGEPYKD